MNLFVIVSRTQSTERVTKFVAVPGQKDSFTTDIRCAAVYQTREDANRNCCGDEVVRPLADFLTIIG